MGASAWPTAGIACLAPTLFLIAVRLAPIASSGHWLLAASASTLSMVAGGLIALRRAGVGRGVASCGIAGFLGTLLAAVPLSPALALSAVLLAVALLGLLWGPDMADRSRLSRRQVRELTSTRAVVASALYLPNWVLLSTSLVEGPVAWAAAGLALLLALGFIAAWMLRARRSGNRRWRWLAAAAAIASVAAAMSPGERAVLYWSALVPAAMIFVPRPREEDRPFGRTWWQTISEHPARLLVMTFAGLCLLGTVLLALPASAETGRSIGILDAAFTAVSAVCVTGLIVLDTPSAFGALGEAFLLVLIQIGGLGIMSFSTVTLSLLGFRPSLRHEAAVAGLIGTEHRGAVATALSRLIGFTFAFEAAGTVLLTASFHRGGAPLPEAAWHGLFTAVSAFCNAGFSLQTLNLVPFQRDPAVIHTVGLLIIIGGLSPATVVAIPEILKRRRVPVEQRIALAATAVLLAGGCIAILALEWRNTLATLPFPDRLHNAWFQSLTTRTAGFNTIDIAALRPATLSVVITLMFIGGSPGGTAGGVKTTTVVVLLLAVGSAIRGRWTAKAFGRRISHRTVYKAASIVTLGVLSLLAGLVALQVTQNLDSRAAIFEAASALGTVGLSIGGTSQLDEVGKLIIMACMFAGRVGPLSLFLFLAGRAQPSPWELVEEDVAVG